MNKKIFSAIAVAATIVAAPALAADISVPAPAPTFTPSSVYDWSGLYVGAHAGGSFESNYESGLINGGGIEGDGFIGGGQIGYNWQFDRIVFGVEGDISYTDIESSGTLAGLGTAVNAETNYISTIRGRVGYAFDNVLVYGTGGVAFADIDVSSPTGAVTGADDTQIGYAVGAGLEYGLAPNWSLRGEYLYTDFGDEDITVAGVGTGNLDTDNHTARAALNYRFNFAPLPAFGK